MRGWGVDPFDYSFEVEEGVGCLRDGGRELSGVGIGVRSRKGRKSPVKCGRTLRIDNGVSRVNTLIIGKGMGDPPTHRGSQDYGFGLKPTPGGRRKRVTGVLC